MARYLNPAKIGLLALVELYAEEAIPSDAILPVLSFLTAHTLHQSPSSSSSSSSSVTTPRWNKAERTANLVVSIKDFERLLSEYPVVKGMPGRKLWDQFLAKLWGIDSLDALHSFFASIPALLKKTREESSKERGGDEQEEAEAAAAAAAEEEDGKTKIKLSRNSPLGAFVRRSKTEFHRLTFEQSTQLWKSLIRYRQPTSQSYLRHRQPTAQPYVQRGTPSLEKLTFDNVLVRAAASGEWDADGVERLVAVAYGTHVLAGDDEGEGGTVPVSTDDVEALVEFQIQRMQKYGDRVPVEIQQQFEHLLRDSFLIPSLTHYLSFLNAWRAGDYTTAFDYLHRYFDYTMQYRDRLFYQYALMNLAVLQADFGCYREAVSAMLETVSTARENRDMTCLNFALNWLFHFGRAHPELVHDLESHSMLGAGKESLAFLRVKAKESAMWTLWSSVLLAESKMALVNGDSVAKSVENMVRSSQIIVERNLKSMFGSQLSLQAALWTRLGLGHLSSCASETFLRCHARNSVFDDELKHTCRIAFALAQRGKYDDALHRLDSLDENSLRSWKPSQYWLKHRAIVKLKRDLCHNNLDAAGRLLDQLLQSKADDLEPDMALVVDSLHIDYLERKGDLQAALAEIDALMVRLRDDGRDVAMGIKLLLLKTALLDRCGRPLRAFSAAVRATNMAWRARLLSCLWQAVGALSTMLVSLAEFDAAVRLLTAVVPRALECDAAAPAAQLYSVLADAHMGSAGNMEPKSSRRTECLKRALRAVQKALDHYSAVEDVERQCETMAKKAMIMKLTGEATLAANYAAAYVELRKRAEALSLDGA
ncbi:hypothetical protein L249_8218 [Ophiocordyceps polyrhachis-furcata BCC 54312]|uniref:Anaphase-promoting complex subunit 5 n=1 Tax=Ophiocordyceps polyrhachis-furcata BCC 54312 TaxID=1330021 RepID=A0A367LH14_9HYPO|nr:hypothetical protein L249_8218 [Ophiocordyceps polyrhachis-furcata BCC 54312]